MAGTDEIALKATLDTTNVDKGVKAINGEMETTAETAKATGGAFGKTGDAITGFIGNLGNAAKAALSDQHANQDAAGALSTLGVNLAALDNPLTAVAGGIKASIDETLTWASTIDKLSRASGESAEKTSQMAVVFEDFGIKADGLDKVIKQFTKNGLQFNLDTIKDLAKQYQAIEDPVARDQFAFDNFGRSGLEMNEILSKTPEELNAVGEAALYSGKIMNEQGVEAAQQFGIKLQQLTDKADGLKIAIGGPLVEVLSNAVDGFNGLVATINAVDIAFEAHAGIISYDEAAARADAAAHGDLFAAFHNVELAVVTLGPPIDKMVSSTADLTENTNASAAAFEGMTVTTNNLTDAQIKAVAAVVDATDKMRAQMIQAALTAGMSGQLAAATDHYHATIASTTPDLEKLQAQLAQYEAAQGQTITITQQGSATQQDYETAVTRLQIAQERLAETHSKSQATLDSLNLSVQTAQQRVDDLSTKMGGGSTATADYSTQIEDLKGKIGDLTAQQQAEADALNKTTAQMIFQNAAAHLDADGALLLSEKMGLLSVADYNLITSVNATTAAYDTNSDGIVTLDENSHGYIQTLTDMKNQTVANAEAQTGAAGPADDLAGHILGVGGAAHHAAGDISDMVVAEDSLHDKLITITTNFLNNTYGPGGPGYEPPHAAHGLDMMVPPGFPNDSFPILAQSGERVIIIPNGGGSNLSSYGTPGAGGGATVAGSTTINYNVTASYPYQDSGSVAQDLRLMSRMRGTP